MSDHPRVGRHRAATRYNALVELTTIARDVGQSRAKASALVLASGGLVASFAMPASASATHHSTAAAPAAATARAALPLAPAVVAPEDAPPVAAAVVGVEGVSAVAKPAPRVAATPAPRLPDRVVRSASRSTTRVAAPAQSSSEVVTIARGLLGIPYVYGGSTPAGFDCSGFTQYVFGKAGIAIPRTASQQQAAARPVRSPQPGDLVFFGSPAWHVGIYTGTGMMIDSPREGKSTSERAVFSGVSGYGRF